jgi:A/G-specific adenine glycosylase
MNTKNCEALLTWYKREHRKLPWRETSDPYSVLVSEFMLQQTTVAAVTPKYHTWMTTFPDFQQLAQAEEITVLTQWSGLGYYQRARRLHNLAREVVRLGFVPDTYEELLKLPGVGPYTAAAVASICFGRPALAVDTNVVRVLFRYYALRKQPQNKKAIEEIRRKTKSSLKVCDPGDFNQALMELGATLCKVKEPKCTACPLASGCQGRRNAEGPTLFPLSPKRRKPLNTPGKVFLVVRSSDQSILLVKGTSLGLLSPLFQPPILFSEVNAQDDFQQALLELQSYLRESVEIREWLIKYGISGRRLLLNCSRWHLGPNQFRELQSSLKLRGLEVALFSPENDNSVPVSSLTRKILEKCWETR